MIKKPFFGWVSPRLKYPVIKGDAQESVRDIPLPQRASLLIDFPYNKLNERFIKKGDRLKTGQKVNLTDDDQIYFISTVTGTVAEITAYTGYMYRVFPSILIENVEEDQWDDEFKNACGNMSAETCLRFLRHLPGMFNLKPLVSPAVPLDTIVIRGIDEDLLVKTNQLVVINAPELLARGVRHLKEITGIDRIIIIVPPGLARIAETSGAEVKVISPFYPNALEKMIMKRVLNRTVPEGKSCEDIGASFINAEAVVTLAQAVERKQIPVDKLFTLIDKDGAVMNVRARIGTQLRDVLAHLNIKTEHGDRLVFGGPMRGRSIYTEDIPVYINTDAITVQHREQIVEYGDIPCINCGECVRACPANIQVNMLIRLLENGLYSEAAGEYDLMSCIKCGLCSYVCTARIPVFHYIMLGLTELEKQKSMEGSNA